MLRNVPLERLRLGTPSIASRCTLPTLKMLLCWRVARSAKRLDRLLRTALTIGLWIRCLTATAPTRGQPKSLRLLNGGVCPSSCWGSLRSPSRERRGRCSSLPGSPVRTRRRLASPETLREPRTCQHRRMHFPRRSVNKAPQPEHINVHTAGSRTPRRSPALTWAGHTSNLRSERTLPSFSLLDLREELDAHVFRGVVAYMVHLQGGVLYAELPVDYLL